MARIARQDGFLHVANDICSTPVGARPDGRINMSVRVNQLAANNVAGGLRPDGRTF